MKVKNELKIFELNGIDNILKIDGPPITIESHPLSPGLVVINFEHYSRNTSVTVSAKDLLKAITNASDLT